MKRKENLHHNHRNRLKQRFIDEGLDNFEDHNVLELLLFYGIPQKDVNETAHRLIKRYSSFSAVFDAPVEDLEKVEGIGRHTAVLLKMIPAVAKRYYADRFKTGSGLLKYEDLGDLFVNEFVGLEYEQVVGYFYDNALKLCGRDVLHKGSINSAGFSMRKIADAVVLKKASFLVIAHNHPHGLPIASDNDLSTTRQLKSFLAQMQVTLLDHFIVAENRYTSTDRQGFENTVRFFVEKSANTEQTVSAYGR